MTGIPIYGQYLLEIMAWADEDRIGYTDTFTPMGGRLHIRIPPDREVEFRLRWVEAIVEEAA